MHHYVKLNRTEAGYFVETWYFRQHRSWVTQLLTDNYDQLGEAAYSSTRAGAEKAHQEALDGVLEALPPNVPPMILRKLS
jgi:hypothetical protein